MANPDRDTVYRSDTDRTIYTRESNSTGWFVGIIVALALLAIAYLVFSANNNQPATNTVTNNPTVTTPAAPVDNGTTNMAPAPAAPANGATVTPNTPATAPADNGATAPATTTEPSAPVSGLASSP